METSKILYYQSPKDGSFYKVKVFGINEEKNICKIRFLEMVYNNMTPVLEQINSVKKIYNLSKFYEVSENQLDKLIIEYLVKRINSESEKFEIKLKMFAALIPLFDKNPELHYKALEHLGKNKLYQKLIHDEINLKNSLALIKG